MFDLFKIFLEVRPFFYDRTFFTIAVYIDIECASCANCVKKHAHIFCVFFDAHDFCVFFFMRIQKNKTTCAYFFVFFLMRMT